MAQKDFYNVLGVSEKATADEIKKQYRRLAKQHHPDSNKGDAKSAERFKEISEAYQVLSDDKKRQQYDEMRRLGAFDSIHVAARGARGGAVRRGARVAPRADRRPNYEEFDVGGLGGLGDLFSSMFGGGARARAAAERSRAGAERRDDARDSVSHGGARRKGRRSSSS